MKNKVLFFSLVIYFLVNGFIFSFLIPPFQKPDEFAHFKKTVSLANLDFFCKKNNQLVPSNLYQVITNPQINLLPFDYQSKMAISLYRQKPANKDKLLLNVSEGCRFQDGFGYLIPAIVYKVFANLNINGFLLFGLMRFLIFLVGYSIILILILKTQNQLIRKIILLLLAMPMTINQMSAFSYDVGHLFFGFIFSLIFFDLVYEKKTRFSLFHLGFSFFGFIFSKPLYEPFFLLFFLLPDLVFKKSKIKKPIFLIIVFFVLGFLRLPSYHYSGISLGNYNPAIQKQIFLEAPLRIFSLLEKTYFTHFSSYIKSTIGVLGWLDFDLDFFIYVLFLVVFGFLIGSYRKKIKISFWQAVVYFLVSFGIFFVLLLAEFLYWTAPGARSIEGVQGRYLIVLIPYFLLLTIYLLSSIWFFVLVVVFTLFLNFRAVYYRYYDYSVYAKPTKDLNQIKRRFISLNPGASKTFEVKDRFVGACYGVYLRFKNKKFYAPVRVEVFDKNKKQTVYFVPSQVSQYNQIVLSEFEKTRFNQPVYVKVINKYANQKLVLFDEVALFCIVDDWR